MDIERNIRQARRDSDALLSRDETYTVEPDAIDQRIQARKASRSDFNTYFSKWENLKVLIGTAYSWFALDVSFFLPHDVSILPHSLYNCLDRILRSRSELIHHTLRDRLWIAEQKRHPRRAGHPHRAS